MTITREQALDKVIRTCGFESPITIWFAECLERFPNTPFYNDDVIPYIVENIDRGEFNWLCQE